MDVGYRAIGSKSGDAVYTDFKPSLTVLTTVVSATHDDLVTGWQDYAAPTSVGTPLIGLEPAR